MAGLKDLVDTRTISLAFHYILLTLLMLLVIPVKVQREGLKLHWARVSDRECLLRNMTSDLNLPALTQLRKSMNSISETYSLLRAN